MSEDAFQRNFDLYNDRNEVDEWTASRGLQVAETAISGILQDRLANMDMLDVGVGGGRTTEHFGPLVRRYFGVDLAPNMVDACRKRFPDLQWDVADASELGQFAAESFDFVLFSFNGIDEVGPTRRQKALDELTRVLRPGGYLAFSSHNLNFYPVFLTKQTRWYAGRPDRLLRNIRHFLGFRKANRHVRFTPELASAVVFEGQLDFTVATYYVRPRHQLETLQAMGVCDIRLFPSDGGEIAIDSPDLETVTTPWIYYFCSKP